jgi:hypothetical protein
MAQQYKRRLIPIVDRAFQFKYTGAILMVAALTSTVLGFFLLKAYREMNEVIGLAAISPEIGEKLNADDAKQVFQIIIFSLVAEVVILGVLGLIITHRVCGPIFVITKHFGTMLSGKYPSLRPLRAGDEFAPMFELFKQLVDKQRDRDAAEISRLTKVMAAAREKGVDAETIASLQILVDERTARISQSASSAHPAGGAA